MSPIPPGVGLFRFRRTGGGTWSAGFTEEAGTQPGRMCQDEGHHSWQVVGVCLLPAPASLCIFSDLSVHPDQVVPPMTERILHATTQKVLRSSFANLVNFAVALPLSFVVVPLLLHHLGREGYGVWTMVNTALSVLVLLQFGVTQGLIKYAAQYDASGDEDSLNETFDSGTALLLMIGLVVLIVGTLFRESVARWLFALPGGPHPDGVRLLTVILVVFFLRHSFIGYSSLLGGLQRLEIVQSINLGGVLISLGGAVWIVFRGGGLVELIWWTCLSAAAALLAFVISALQVRPGFQIHPSRWNSQCVMEVFAYSIKIFGSGLANILHLHWDKIVLASGFSRIDLAGMYGIAAILTSKLMMIPYLVSSPLLAASAELGSRGGSDLVAVFYRRSQRVNGMISFLVFGGAFGVGSSLVSVWLEEAPDIILINLYALSIGGLFYALAQPAMQVLNGHDHPEAVMKNSLIGAVLNLVLSPAVALGLGLRWIGVATAFAMICESTLNFRSLTRLVPALKNNSWPEHGSTCFFAAFFAAGVGQFLARGACRSNPIPLAAGAVAYCGLYVTILAFKGVLTRSDLNMIGRIRSSP